MLAAAQNDPYEMELFRLTLSLISKEEENIPSKLQKYLEKIINQAQNLAKNPTSINKNILPEAIDLALEMRLHENVSQQINHLSNYASITPYIARELLSTMENNFACKKHFRITS